MIFYAWLQIPIFNFLQVGCGVGNTIFPLLEVNTHPQTRVYACDFSSTAVDLVKQHPDYNKHLTENSENENGRCNAFVCDITKPEDWQSNAPFQEESLGMLIRNAIIFLVLAIIIPFLKISFSSNHDYFYFNRCRYSIICDVCS